MEGRLIQMLTWPRSQIFLHTNLFPCAFRISEILEGGTDGHNLPKQASGAYTVSAMEALRLQVLTLCKMEDASILFKNHSPRFNTDHQAGHLCPPQDCRGPVSSPCPRLTLPGLCSDGGLHVASVLSLLPSYQALSFPLFI